MFKASSMLSSHGVEGITNNPLTTTSNTERTSKSAQRP